MFSRVSIELGWWFDFFLELVSEEEVNYINSSLSINIEGRKYSWSERALDVDS